MEDILETAGKLLSEGGAAVLCTVIRSEGSAPRHVGTKMLVMADGHFVGTLGGGELEHRVIAEARSALADGKPRRLEYTLSDPNRGDPGVCGGQVEVFVEPLLSAPTLLVVGTGHVGKAVAQLGKWLGFRVVASDDREEFCNPETIPDADEFLVCSMKDLPQRLRTDARTCMVLTTRGSALDVDGLPALLGMPAAYLGVIGSRRRWAVTRKELVARGVAEAALARIHSPMGLELQAETPEEIAVSILAEVLMVRDRGSGHSMRAAGTGDDEVGGEKESTARRNLARART